MAQVWTLGIVPCSVFTFISLVPFIFPAFPLPLRAPDMLQPSNGLSCFPSYHLNSSLSSCQGVKKTNNQKTPTNIEFYVPTKIHSWLPIALDWLPTLLTDFPWPAAHIWSLISCYWTLRLCTPVIWCHLWITWFHNHAELCSLFRTYAAFIALCSPLPN